MSEDEEHFMELLEEETAAALDEASSPDEPVEDANEVLTEAPTDGVGWCAPSP